MPRFFFFHIFRVITFAFAFISPLLSPVFIAFRHALSLPSLMAVRHLSPALFWLLSATQLPGCATLSRLSPLSFDIDCRFAEFFIAFRR